MATQPARMSRDPETNDLIYLPERAVQPPAAEPADAAAHFENLATTIPQADLDALSTMLTEQIANDEYARSGWEKMVGEHTELLGTGPESKPDELEYEASDTSDHPLLLTALTRFQAKALSALNPAGDAICRYEPAIDLDMVEDPKERAALQEKVDAAGRRVVKYYTDYLLNEHPSYIEDTDLIIYECGLHGAGVRKVYNDRTREGAETQLDRVRGQDLIISYDTTSWRCGRITHREDVSTPEMVRRIASGAYRPVTGLRGEPTAEKDTLTLIQDKIQGLSGEYMMGGESHRVYETVVDLFLGADRHPQGLARPYIVTLHSHSREILSIQRNWQPGDRRERPIERYVVYLYHPGVSAVRGMGLGHLLGNITRALRRAQRRALDAAYLANHPSGFKLGSLKIRDDATVMRPGEFADIDSPTGDIRAAIMAHPFAGPNAGLLGLAEKMEQNGRELGGIASLDFTQLMKANVAAGPAMAAFEESSEFQTAVQRRLYDAQATEFRLLHARRKEVLGSRPVPFGTNGMLQEGDLTLVNIIPYMRPGQASRQRQLLEAQAIAGLADGAPDIINKRVAVERYLRALGTSDLSELLLPDPADEPPPPMDPASEYAAILAGKPVRAAPHQNHQAHIDAHGAQMRGLQLSQLPIDQGEAAQAAIAAHIAEHMGLDMVVRAAAAAGIPLTQLGPDMPPELEVQLAPMVSQAIVELEAERAAQNAAPDPDAGKIRVEQVKQQGAQQLEQLKARHAAELKALEARFRMEEAQLKEDAATHREEIDNETALEIAHIRGAGGPRATAPAGATAGAQGRSDASPRRA